MISSNWEMIQASKYKLTYSECVRGATLSKVNEKSLLATQ